VSVVTQSRLVIFRCVGSLACVTRSFFVNVRDYDNLHLVEVGCCCEVLGFVVGRRVVSEG
jgi:hypothetical protein